MPEGNRLGVVPDASIYSAIGEPKSAAEQMSEMLRMQQLQTGVDSGKINLAHKQLSHLRQMLGDLASNENVSIGDVQSTARDAVRLGLTSPDRANLVVGNATQLAGNPIALRGYLRRLHLDTVSSHDAFKIIHGEPTVVDTGGQKVVIRPGLNGTTAQGTIANTFTPEQKTGTQTVTIPGGGTRAIPRTELYTDEGDLRGEGDNKLGARMPLPPPAPSRFSAPTATSGSRPNPLGPQGGVFPAPRQAAPRPAPQPAFGGSPVVAPAAPVPAASVPTPAPTVPPAPSAPMAAAPIAPGGPRGFVTSLAPAEASANDASAKDWADLRSDIDASRMRVLMLREAKAAAEGTTTGIGTGTRNQLQSFIQSAPMIPDSVKRTLAGDEREIAAYDRANKYMSAYQMLQKGAGRSDLALGTAKSATPSTDTSPEALRELIPVMIGQEHERQARAHHYLQSDPIQKNPNPAGYSNWNVTEWSKRNDPKAFGVTDMTADQRRKYFESLSPEGKARFRASIRAGMDAGIITTRHLAGE